MVASFGGTAGCLNLPSRRTVCASSLWTYRDVVPAQLAVPAVVRKRREHTCKKKEKKVLATF